MNLPTIDQARKMEQTSYGECVRLSNELRAKPSYVNRLGVTVPAKDGFDLETADFNKFAIWLSNPLIKKSASLFWYVIRIMAWRFPTKHTDIRFNLSTRRRLEFDLILSQMKKEFEWCGKVGYQNNVVLEKANELNKKDIKVLINKDRYTIKKL